jgi:hypothetical protein
MAFLPVVRNPAFMCVTIAGCSSIPLKMPVTVEKKKPWWASHIEVMSFLRRHGYVM